MKFASLRTRLVGTSCLVAASLAALSLDVAPARAALVPLGLKSLTQKSDLVVTGRVVGARSYLGSYYHLGEIAYTDVTIEIDQVLRGELAERTKTIVVQTRGGVFTDWKQVWPEEARFERDERVLLFLRRSKDARSGNKLRATGWRQGKYRLSKDGTVVLGQSDLPIGRSTQLSRVELQIDLYAAASASTAEGNAPDAASGSTNTIESTRSRVDSETGGTER